MANIILGYRQDLDKRDAPIITYATSIFEALYNAGHCVIPLGEGHEYTTFDEMPTEIVKQYELFIDIDCGRNTEGELSFHCLEEKAPIPSAVRLIDSHGHPSLHKRMAPNYDHVFFAVWSKRDLFANHPSAHWCPNASDAKYFNITPHPFMPRQFDVGFFGSKHGLDRADSLKKICERTGLTYDIREMGRRGNRWPFTGESMAKCKVLFNCGQKHDGPNQRVLESMLMNRPLINDSDPLDGMSKLFELGEHYLSYASEAELEDNLAWCLRETTLASSMAIRAYELALKKHQVKHRVDQILEVCFG